jgi:acetoin utilization deacetylase AcuC-like enzyme
MSLCAWISHPDCRLHEMGAGHPERPERLDAINDHLLATGLMALLVPYDAPLATVEQLGRAHSTLYVREILETAPGSGYVHVDPDTLMNPGTVPAALRAAGAAVLATDLVLRDEVRRAFCAVRPPGHHATREAAMGFCFFNNACVGIRHALDVHGLARVALVDFDVHHGNGSEDILAGDERALMVSTFEQGLYPFNGDEARGPNMVNVPLAPRSDGAALREAWEMVWAPRLEDFRPQLVYISAGFDGHRSDGMASLRWTDEDYGWITRRVVELAERHCDGRVISCLEGGYELFPLARSVAVHLRELSGAA